MLPLLLLLPLLATGAPSPSSASTTTSSTQAASGVAGVVQGIALAPQPDCKDVGVRQTSLKISEF
jgi:hypothetical protein